MVLRRIRKIRQSKNSELCLKAAHWVLQYHMTAFSACENHLQMTDLMRNAESDLTHVLELLDMEFKNKADEMQALVISTDIAQKLSRFDKLAVFYPKLLEQSKSNPQFGFMTLSVAPSMGDWKMFYETCSKLEKEYKDSMGPGIADPINSIVEALHQLAESGMPDLGVLYSFVSELELFRKPKCDPHKLFEKTVNIDKIEVELLKVVSDDEEQKNLVIEMFEKEKNNELNLEDLAIAVNGGIILFPGLSRDVPQMLVGPYYDGDKIQAEGFLDLQVQESDEMGNPKLGFNSPEFSEMLMRAMPPEILEAIQTGEISPDVLFEAVGRLSAIENSQKVNIPLPKANPGVQAAFVKFLENFQRMKPEITKRFGTSITRQQERVVLTKTEGGYEGQYIVRNYNPHDRGNETSLVLALRLRCEHLPAPALAAEVESIASGIDDLVLE